MLRGVYAALERLGDDGVESAVELSRFGVVSASTADDAERLGVAVRSVEGQLRDARSRFVAGSSAATGFGTAVASTVDDLAAQTTALGRAESATQTYAVGVQRAGVASRQASGALTQSLGQIAFVIDDLQYVGTQGIRPLINNLAPIAISFGALGASVAVLGTAAAATFSNWDDLVQAIGMAPESVDATIARMKALAEETDRVTISANRAQAAVRGLRPDEAAESGKRFAEALARGSGPGGPEDLAARLATAEQQRLESADRGFQGLSRLALQEQARAREAEERFRAEQERLDRIPENLRTPLDFERYRLARDEFQARQASLRSVEQALLERQGVLAGQADERIAGLLTEAQAGRGFAQEEIRRRIARLGGRENLVAALAPEQIGAEAVARDRAEEEAAEERARLAQLELEQQNAIRQQREEQRRQIEAEAEAERQRLAQLDAEQQDAVLAQREQQRQEAAQRAAADAALFGGGLQEQAQAMLSRGVPQEQVALQAAQAIFGNGLRDEGRARAAGAEVVAQAQQANTERLAELQNAGLRRDAALQQLMAENVATLRELADALLRQQQEQAAMFGGLGGALRAIRGQIGGGGRVFQPRRPRF